VLRDVVAFANSGGGTIFVGASAAEKRPVHGVEEAETAADSLRAEIAAQVMPPVEAAVEIVASDGKDVLVVSVAEGREKPHALLPSTILVRHGAESEAASRDEIVAMVTANAVVPGAAGSVAPVAEHRRPGSNGNGRASLGSVPDKARVATPRPHGGEGGRRNGNRELDHLDDATSALPVQTGAPGLDVYEEAVEADPVAPTTGVEVVHAYEQEGVVYYTLRDLRDHKLIHNLTRDTDRRLFRSAIAQHEEQAVDEEKVRWQGDFGLWRTYRPRGGERRYHLVYAGDGDLRVFYGVSEAGMDGPWQAFLGNGS
jgi:hypothetical protein